VTFTLFGPPHFSVGPQQQLTVESATWVHEFVVNCIILWQNQNLAPRIADEAREGAQELLLGS
ncbi:hypothetical protein KA005_37875, partial [bacterium]|nr:hypothetical protein [bacterium]